VKVSIEMDVSLSRHIHFVSRKSIDCVDDIRAFANNYAHGEARRLSSSHLMFPLLPGTNWTV